MHICPLPHCRVKVPGGQDVIIHLSAPVIIHTWHCNTYIVLIPITQLCPTLCDPVDCNPPASSVHGILQARILECAAIVLSLGDLPNPGIEPWYPAFPSPRIRKWQPTPYSCLGESHGQRNLAGYSPWDRKELDMTEQHSLTHSLTPALLPDSLPSEPPGCNEVKKIIALDQASSTNKQENRTWKFFTLFLEI